MLEREHELAEIDATLSAAVAGTGRLLVIAGEAGIGKTRAPPRSRSPSSRSPNSNANQARPPSSS